MEKNILKLLKNKLPFKKTGQNVVKNINPIEKKPVEQKNRPIIISDSKWEEFTKKAQETIEEAIVDKSSPLKKAEKLPQKKVSSSKKNIKTDKNQIPVIDNKKELEKLFNDPDYIKKGKNRVKPAPLNPQIKNRISKKELKNKNGIKVIQKTSDINEFFLSSSASSKLTVKQPADNERAFLNAKKDGLKIQKPLSLEKRIERYPKPELTLDLHGFTSIQAKLKVENFILSSFSKGYFTLKIITGRGNHSEFGAVLPEITEDIVNEMISEKKVLSYKWENINKETSGSMIIYLNRFELP
ncbi:MAG: Smr/MutS family protein [Desulfobacteraceae bacterium]|nr:Smr/MutS family protein [Desulfobacteraceae bacterium]